jgi:hypothetical protein
MNDLLKTIVVCGFAMLGIAGVIFGLGDAKTLVPPPEAVAEGFVRTLAAGRYARATPFLSKRLATTTDESNLRAIAKQIEAGAGGILDVRGQTDSIDGEFARATAIVKTRSGERYVELRLVRESGVWSIDEIKVPESLPTKVVGKHS